MTSIARLITSRHSPKEHYSPSGRGGDEPLRYLFVASTGGHLAELMRLSRSMNVARGSLWVSFDSHQSRSLLAGKEKRFVRYIRPRDWLSMLRTLPIAATILRERRYDVVISTGAALAMVFLPVARWMKYETVYIESISRVRGPSMTGRLLKGARLATTYTQHSAWSSARWRPHPPVLAKFRVEQRAQPMPTAPSVFVTLGTIRPYGFDRLVNSLLTSGAASESTVWQLGATRAIEGMPGRVVDQISAEDFEDLYRQADVVVTHAGVGTILSLLEAGIYPVVVPRRQAFGEHVDNHQLQIAGLLKSLGIAEVVEADEDLAAAVRRALDRRVVEI